MQRAIISALTAAALLAVSTHAQQPAQTPQAAPTFRTNTRLSVQTVTVKDKDGKSIEGLTAKDFVVTEDGEPQSIAFVEFQRLPPPRTSTQVSLADATPEAPAATPPPAKPGADSVTDVKIATGQPGDIKYRNKRLIVLYFEMNALQPPDLLRAYNGAIKYVKS